MARSYETDEEPAVAGTLMMKVAIGLAMAAPLAAVVLAKLG